MKQTFVLTTAVVVLAVGISLGMLVESRIKASAIPQKAPETQAGDYTLSGPYTHKNLTIFIVHGKDLVKGKIPLTLQEALAQKKVVVYETQDVNELAIENRSNEDVYV